MSGRESHTHGLVFVLSQLGMSKPRGPHRFWPSQVEMNKVNHVFYFDELQLGDLACFTEFRPEAVPPASAPSMMAVAPVLLPSSSPCLHLFFMVFSLCSYFLSSYFLLS